MCMESSKQGYSSGEPFPTPGHLPDSGIEPGSPALQADPLLSEPPSMVFKFYMNLFLKCEPLTHLSTIKEF